MNIVLKDRLDGVLAYTNGQMPVDVVVEPHEKNEAIAYLKTKKNAKAIRIMTKQELALEIAENTRQIEREDPVCQANAEKGRRLEDILPPNRRL